MSPVFATPFQAHPLCSFIPEETPVQAGGRVKPYAVLADESIRFLSGKGYKKLSNDKDEIFCSLMFFAREATPINFPILVEHIKTKELLNIKEDKQYINGEVLVNQESLLRSEILRLKENDSFKKDLNKLYNRLDLYKKIISGEAYTIFNSENQWVPIDSQS